MNDMIYNMKINRLFKSLTVLVRDIKKDVIENKKEDYKKRIDIIHKEAMEIPDEIIASIPKIDIDESKISLHQFKMNPYNYIRLLTEHFYMEKKKTFDIVNKIESQFITIGLQLKEEYHNNIEMYKSIDIWSIGQTLYTLWHGNSYYTHFTDLLKDNPNRIDISVKGNQLIESLLVWNWWIRPKDLSNIIRCL